MRLRAFAFALSMVGGSLALSPAPARAQSDAALRDALDRFQEGLDAAAVANQNDDRAKWDEARVKFLEAYAVVRRPSLVYNLAYSEERLGRVPDAVSHYREYLAFETDKPKKQEAQTRLAALLTKVGQLRIEAPEHTDVLVDGVAVAGHAPFADPIPVTPGAHEVKGRLLGREAKARVEVSAGQTVAVPLPLPEPSAPKRPSLAKMITTGAVAATALGAFVTAGVLKAQERNAAAEQEQLQQGYPANACTEAPSARCDELTEVGQSRERYDVGAGIALGVGIGLAGGAVATWFLWPNTEPASLPDESAPPRARVRVVPTWGGALVTGQF